MLGLNLVHGCLREAENLGLRDKIVEDESMTVTIVKDFFNQSIVLLYYAS